jgi:hypothetical protein
VQALPLPYDQVAFEHLGRELTRYHFGPGLRRPFLYPVVGPSGRSLTRMGHPHAAYSHSHHNSAWIAHSDVDGDNFWGDTGPARILHQWTVDFTEGDGEAAMASVCHWVGAEGKLRAVERRRMAVRPLDRGEWILTLDLHLEPGPDGLTLGKSPFGLCAVRMARSLGVADGGGRILDSEGRRNEKGPDGIFWKRARWVDYAGPILPGTAEGVTLFDHPANPNHPSHFHVRDDGWMGASFSFEAPVTVARERPLRLRYGLYVHRGAPAPAEIEPHWRRWAADPLPPLSAARA